MDAAGWDLVRKRTAWEDMEAMASWELMHNPLAVSWMTPEKLQAVAFEATRDATKAKKLADAVSLSRQNAALQGGA